MRIKYYNLLLIISTLIACNEEIEVSKNIDDFNVTTSTTTYKAGETINFNFTGNPGIISFYSGEVGSDYAFKDGRITETEATKTMSFTSSVSLGDQANQLSVMVSSDFNGNRLAFSNVEAATWTDVTSRFKLSTSASFLASGNKDISDLAVEGKPLYVAFKYITRPQTENGVARQWMIRNFVLTTSSPIGTLTLADSKNAGFMIVDQNPLTYPARSSVSSTTVTLLGHNFTAEKDTLSENWAISNPINLGSIDQGPDRPIAVKGNSDARMDSFSYVYQKPGTYKVWFIASNTNIDQNLVVIRQLDITITE